MKLEQGYWIIDLSNSFFSFLGRLAYRRTVVPLGKKTLSHKHMLFSFYLVERLDSLEGPSGRRVDLPEQALVIVLPWISHSWVNFKPKEDVSHVYDLTPLHRPHVMV